MDSVMKVQLITVLLLTAIARKVLSQENRRIILWDRVWLNNNISELSISVRFGDQIQFLCQVNNSNPRYENLIGLRDEQEADQCSTTADTSVFIDFCRGNEYDIIVDVTNSPPRATQSFRFEAGLVHYFTSFSTGTADSAQTSRTEGGSCASMPPLKLAVSVDEDTVTTSSAVMPTSSLSAVLPTASTSSSSSTTSSMVVTSLEPSSSSTSIGSTPTPGQLQNSSEQLVPSRLIILLFVTAIYLLL